MLLAPAGSAASGFEGWQRQDEGPRLSLSGYGTSVPEPGLWRGAKGGLAAGVAVIFHGRNGMSQGLSALGVLREADLDEVKR